MKAGKGLWNDYILVDEEYVTLRLGLSVLAESSGKLVNIYQLSQHWDFGNMLLIASGAATF